MKFWVDAQPSPGFAHWLADRWQVKVVPVREIGLRDASDRQIYEEAKTAGAIVITKDSDFIELSQRLGPPPQIVWVTCGNVSEHALRSIFERRRTEILAGLDGSARVVEVSH